MKILSKAPTRIDLAGGTIDINPLYLFFENAKTINLAISLYAHTTLEVTITPNKKKLQAILQSEDQKSSHCIHHPQETVPDNLRLHQEVLSFFWERFLKNLHADIQLQITTSCAAPAGSGLGGSSSLAISLAASFWELCSFFGFLEKFDTFKHGQILIRWVSDIEAKLLRTPVGLQDYYAAVYGGLQSIHWRSGGPEHFFFDQNFAKSIAQNTSLIYSGKSHHSGLNNWDIFQRCLNKEAHLLKLFTQIVQATNLLEQACLKRSALEVIHPIQIEWQARSQLIPSISTPEIDIVQQSVPKCEHAFKICGAGAGGCFFLTFVDAHQKTKIIPKLPLSKWNMQELGFEVDLQGLSIHTLLSE